MITVLYIVGVIVILASFIAGIVAGGFGMFLLTLAGGVVSGITFFALARMLENQEEIKETLYMIDINSKKAIKKEKTICEKCGKKYYADMTSCPYCGKRNENPKF